MDYRKSINRILSEFPEFDFEILSQSETEVTLCITSQDGAKCITKRALNTDERTFRFCLGLTLDELVNGWEAGIRTFEI